MKLIRRNRILTLCIAITLFIILVVLIGLRANKKHMSTQDQAVSEEVKNVINEEMLPIANEEDSDEVTIFYPTNEVLAKNDFILYYVNCGASIVDKVAEGDKMGLLQSVTDKLYGMDSTGYSWGHRESNKNSKYVSGGDSSSVEMEDTYYYVSTDVSYVSGISGFYYDFQLPDGEYIVTVGFKNPWSHRTIEIDLEENRVTNQLSLDEGMLVESSHEIKVIDGELNVFIHNPRRADRYQDPILSYIIIKAMPIYDFAYLNIKMESIENAINELKSKGVTFATETLDEKYIDQYGKADTINELNDILEIGNEMLSSKNGSAAEIEEISNKLEDIYTNLRTIPLYNSFTGTNGDLLKDTNGVPIQAHGGQVQFLNGKWWWYGEDKTRGYRSNGISAYSSDDLYNWTFEGYVMRSVSSREQLDTDEYFKNLYADYSKEEKDNVFLCINDSTSVIERPKMIYNKKTNKYIIWFHADGPTESSTANYAAACAGVAISDSPTGPFRFIDRYRLNISPKDQIKGEWYEEHKGFARDMNLFIDDDHTAYIIYSSEENMTMFISKLNDEYTYLATSVEDAVHGKDFVRLFPGAQREAPAIFKFKDKYYMITSGATGWAPNQGRYWMSDSMLGDWIDMGDPFIGDIKKTSFDSQSTNVIPYDTEKGLFIFMGDRWFSNNLGDSRYIWLPIEFTQNQGIRIRNNRDWTMDDFVNK